MAVRGHHQPTSPPTPPMRVSVLELSCQPNPPTPTSSVMGSDDGGVVSVPATPHLLLIAFPSQQFSQHKAPWNRYAGDGDLGRSDLINWVSDLEGKNNVAMSSTTGAFCSIEPAR